MQLAAHELTGCREDFLGSVMGDDNVLVRFPLIDIEAGESPIDQESTRSYRSTYIRVRKKLSNGCMNGAHTYMRARIRIRACTVGSDLHHVVRVVRGEHDWAAAFVPNRRSSLFRAKGTPNGGCPRSNPDANAHRSH